MEVTITNCHELFSYSWQYSAGIQHSMPHFTFMCCCYTAFPSELSFRIFLVSNFHDIELLMRIIVLDNANAADALAENNASAVHFLMHAFHQQKRPYLEHLDEKENLGVFEIDGPSARNARDDRVDE